MLTCPWYTCMLTHTFIHIHNDEDAHVQNTRKATLHTHTLTHTHTQMSWPLAVGHVPLISVTLVIKGVSIFLTSAPQQCEYTVYQDTCSSFPPVVHTRKLDCLCNNLPTGAVYWTAQVIYMRVSWNGLEASKAVTQRFYGLTCSVGKQTNKHILVANPSVQLSLSQSGRPERGVQSVSLLQI